MKVAVFDIHRFERTLFEETKKDFGFEFSFFDHRLNSETASGAVGHDVVCAFVNDRLDAATLTRLKQAGVRLIALRSAGFNHVDLNAARSLNLPVVRVPAYSPYAVAEHAVALLLTLNRKTHRAYQRVREMNFSLEGLIGFDLHGKTVGLIGTGRIGTVMAEIMLGFGCRVLAYDPQPNPELMKTGKVQYVDLETLYRESLIISLHVPLTPSTRHLIDARSLALMQKGVVLINTSRGALVDTRGLIEALKTGHVGAAGLDVYEEEENLFFEDHSGDVLQDDLLARLLTFPNVLITSHQGFLTNEALHNIVMTTLENIRSFQNGGSLVNQVSAPSN